MLYQASNVAIASTAPRMNGKATIAPKVKIRSIPVWMAAVARMNPHKTSQHLGTNRRFSGSRRVVMTSPMRKAVRMTIGAIIVVDRIHRAMPIRLNVYQKAALVSEPRSTKKYRIGDMPNRNPAATSRPRVFQDVTVYVRSLKLQHLTDRSPSPRRWRRESRSGGQRRVTPQLQGGVTMMVRMIPCSLRPRPGPW